jgi:FkbM family methyltransferase
MTVRRLHAGIDIVVDERDRDGITQAVLQGRWTMPPHYSLVRAFGATRVLDLGAHIGTFALFAAAQGCRVLAVEASPRNAALLQASAAQNGFDQLMVACTAVGETCGTARFLQAGPYGFIATAARPATIEVPITTVDALVEGTGWNGVDFVKMDIEGSEVAAVRGMTRLLQTAAPPIVFESNGHALHLLGQQPSEIRLLLAAAGYDCYLIRQRRLVPVTPNELQPECNVDYVAVRGLLPALEGWTVAPRATEAERDASILASCRDGNPHVRAYIARALDDADGSLLGSGAIASALRDLTNDPIEDVRAAASWFLDRVTP